MCWGRGPAWPDDTASTEVIGRLQADKAKDLWASGGRPLSGPVDARHVWVDMSAVEVKPSRWTRPGRTCKAAMGFSFAAGTTDGGFASEGRCP
jgi:neutral ceramidase